MFFFLNASLETSFCVVRRTWSPFDNKSTARFCHPGRMPVCVALPCLLRLCVAFAGHLPEKPPVPWRRGLRPLAPGLLCRAPAGLPLLRARHHPDGVVFQGAGAGHCSDVPAGGGACRLAALQVFRKGSFPGRWMRGGKFFCLRLIFFHGQGL